MDEVSNGPREKKHLLVRLTGLETPFSRGFLAFPTKWTKQKLNLILLVFMVEENDLYPTDRVRDITG